MEQWEHEAFGHVTQDPGFKLNAKHRKQFRHAEEAVNARLAKPPETHLHPEIAQPATLTRHRVNGVRHEHTNELNSN